MEHTTRNTGEAPVERAALEQGGTSWPTSLASWRGDGGGTNESMKARTTC